jgi:hypothetical protein
MAQGEGRYVYGIAAGGRAVKLGQMGVGGEVVYTIPYRDLCAIVHDCPREPYRSSDDEVVKRWVSRHQDVLDEAKKHFDSIIPLGFDCILEPKDGMNSPDQVVTDWLEEDYDRLQAVGEKIAGKDEYAVQIFYDRGVVGSQVSEQNEEIRKMKEEMATKSPGMAYMYRQMLEKVITAEMEELVNQWFKDLYGRIKGHCDDIVVEKTKKVDKDKVMLLNFSCLVAREKVNDLGEELEGIQNKGGFSVRFSGPWPPYSFVAKPTIATADVKVESNAT